MYCHHMACVVYLEKGEAIRFSEHASSCAIDIERFQSGFVEILLVVPVERESPRLVAKPVANVVLVSSIQQNSYAVFELVRNHLSHTKAGEYKKTKKEKVDHNAHCEEQTTHTPPSPNAAHLLVIVHPISPDFKGQSDGTVAVLPAMARHAQVFLDCGNRQELMIKRLINCLALLTHKSMVEERGGRVVL